MKNESITWILEFVKECTRCLSPVEQPANDLCDKCRKELGL